MNRKSVSGSGSSWWLGAGTVVLLSVVVAACNWGGDTSDAEAIEPQELGTSTTVAAAAVTTVDATGGSSEDSPDDSPPPAEDAAAPVGLTFSADIEPIITETCASCHTGDGPGTQHVRFDTAGKVSRAAFAIAIVTESRYMPPWPAGDDSVPFDHDWSLTDEEIAGILEWDAAGAPLDVDPDKEMIPANGVVGIDDPDVVMRANGSYDGEFGQPDEYRCFVYDPQITERSFVSQMEFIPQQTQVVHHAVGFVVGAQDRAAIAELEGSDGQGGWTCFGFSPGRSADLVFTWAPGTDATAYPAGTGLEMHLATSS